MTIEYPGRQQPALLAPDRVLHRRAAELSTKFAGTVGAETVERLVLESYAALRRTATVDTHLPVLAGRFAEERLTALAQAKGTWAEERPEVLFVCVHNAGRSQLAAALMTELSGGRVHVRSAGSQPAAQVDPAVAAVIAEDGLDRPEAQAFPKPLTDDVVQAADVVVTMGCGDACPIYPGKRYEDWDVADPFGLNVEAVRAIRDDIATHVRRLLAELLPDQTPH
ncbi:three-helix bundle dimerization domain-containing protein [Pseudokineococcus lusitanus]|uniref:Protein-tyrosine-phosphatase n=1 Tax=Pseudokineococcus lusitanus TaxID=763993 RepID=A0A3N1HQH2_9ACTN|nr:arsenate reductase ArsC [Pseudokineococcus lusitanus]ROP44686.1 protein-tyrosine-phosphatase [Pseudokineococcus lusitanus]